MALVRYKSNIYSVRGRVGSESDALVYYQVGDQDIARTQGDVRDPHTPLQQLHRSIRASLAMRYSRLSLAHMDSWRRVGEALGWGSQSGAVSSRNGGHAYQSINTHRCLAGLPPTDVAPEVRRVEAPESVVRAVGLVDGRLRLVLKHTMAVGVGFWRLRLTPSLGSGGRRALSNKLRLATLAPAASYIPIQPSLQTVECQTRYAYRVGEYVGVEILALSSDFVPGAVLFLRHVPIEGE